MKSSRQRRDEIKTARKTKRLRRIRRTLKEIAETRTRYISDHVSAGAVPVDPAMLGHNTSYGDPEFLKRGTYLDLPFICIACGEAQVWSAARQKWWYEVAKGDLFSTAKRCRPCRIKERARKSEARRVHLEGLKHRDAPKI